MKVALPLPPSNLRFLGCETDEELLNGISNLCKVLTIGGFTLDKDILDIGCGYARLAYGLYDLGYSNRYVGIDVLKPHIDFSKQVFSSYPNYQFFHIDLHNGRYNKNGKISVGDLDLNLDKPFDYICLFSVFTHMVEEDIMNYLKYIKKNLKQDGTCLSTFFSFNDDREAYLKTASIPTTIKINSDLYIDSNEEILHVRCYSEKIIGKMIDSSGLKIKKILYGNWCGGNVCIPNIYQDMFVLEHVIQ